MPVSRSRVLLSLTSSTTSIISGLPDTLLSLTSSTSIISDLEDTFFPGNDDPTDETNFET